VEIPSTKLQIASTNPRSAERPALAKPPRTPRRLEPEMLDLCDPSVFAREPDWVAAGGRDEPSASLWFPSRGP